MKQDTTKASTMGQITVLSRMRDHRASVPSRSAPAALVNQNHQWASRLGEFINSAVSHCLAIALGGVLGYALKPAVVVEKPVVVDRQVIVEVEKPVVVDRNCFVACR